MGKNQINVILEFEESQIEPQSGALHITPSRQTYARLTDQGLFVIKLVGFSKSGIPYGIRTRVAAVKGRCPKPLDERDASSFVSFYSKRQMKSSVHISVY